MIKISTAARNSMRYIARQNEDAIRYGENEFCDAYGITEEIISKITPFRRLSKKSASLSEPKYFIKNFEQKNGKDYLPTNWENLTENEKVDYVVKERYSRLVSHKILSSIKDEKVEHHFSLGADGELLTHDKGKRDKVTPRNLLRLLKNKTNNKKPKISIHNHPQIIEKEILKHMKKTEPEVIKNMGQPFSNTDISNDIYRGMRSYLIDSFGNRYMFVPKNKIIGDKELAFNVNYDLKGINNYCVNENLLNKVKTDFVLFRENQQKNEQNKNSATYKSIIAEYYKTTLDLKKRFYLFKTYIENKTQIGKLQKLI